MKMSDEPNSALSIIVPTYNHEKYIRKALDSIFMQETVYSYEVLIGDDASSDGTQNILKEYKEKFPDKINLFLRGENLGSTRNIYELLMLTKGKYLAILDGDDYWTAPDKLQKQIDFLENNPQFIGVCHKFATVDSAENPIKYLLGWVKYRKIFKLKDFKGIYLPSQPSTFVRRNIYTDKSRDYSFLYKIDKYTSDITSLMLFLQFGDFYLLDKVMSVYRISTSAKVSSVSQIRYKQNSKAIEDDLEMIRNLENLAREKFNNSVDFTLRKKELYTSAIVRSIKTFHFKNLDVLRKIRGERSRLAFLAYIPIGIFKRLIRKMYGVL